MTTQFSAHQGVSARELLYVLFKRKFVVGMFVLATVATICVYVFLIAVPTYTASARLLLQMGREHVQDLGIVTGGAVRPTVYFNPENQGAIATEMLTSSQLIYDVVAELGPETIYSDIAQRTLGIRGRALALFGVEELVPDRVKQIHATGLVAETLGVAPLGATGLLRLSFSHPDPEIAGRVLNEIIDAYISRNLELHQSPALDRFFAGQLTGLQDRLRLAESALSVFKAQHHISGSMEQEKERVLKLALLADSALTETESGIQEAESRLRLLQQQERDFPPVVKFAPGGNVNAAIAAKLREDLMVLELDLLKYNEETAVARSMRSKVERLRKKLKTLDVSVGDRQDEDSRSSLPDRTRAQVLEAQVELGVQRVRYESLLARARQHETRLASLDEAETEMRALEDEVSLARENYRLHQTQSQESQLAKSMDSERLVSVKVVEKARIPTNSHGSNSAMLIVLGLVLGSFGGVTMALAIELVKGTVEYAEEIESYLGIPVLASIPERPGL